MKLWSLRTGECVNTFDEHAGKIWALATGGEAESLMVTGACPPHRHTHGARSYGAWHMVTGALVVAHGALGATRLQVGPTPPPPLADLSFFLKGLFARVGR